MNAHLTIGPIITGMLLLANGLHAQYMASSTTGNTDPPCAHAEMAMRAGEHQELLAHYALLSTNDPSNMPAMMAKSFTLAMMGQETAATRYFSEALDAWPKWVITQWSRRRGSSCGMVEHGILQAMRTTRSGFVDRDLEGPVTDPEGERLSRFERHGNTP